MFRKKGGDEKRRKHRIFRVLVVAAVLVFVVLLWGPTVYVNLSTRHQRYELSRVDIKTVPKRDVGIVLGAALRHRGTQPSDYLKWRIDTAVKLYKAGRVKSLLMSGDGSYYDHDEPYIMQREAIAQGVPADKIAMDKFGFDTYDSCSRAVVWHDVHSATLVTQGYHLPRAVYSCREFGIDTIGVNAQSLPREGWTPYAIFREWLSTDKLFVQLARHDFRVITQVGN